MENVLVVGATGILGTEICRQLVDSGLKVRGLVRSGSDPEKVKKLNELGVETVVGYLKDKTTLDAIVTGSDTVISTASSTISSQAGDSIETVDRQGQLNLVEAADKAFVEKFIYISFSESPYSFPLQDAKREVEERIIDSNMNYTILRPTFFMEIWLGPQLGLDPANFKATIYGHGVNKVSWISFRDVAQYAVASLNNPASVNTILDLGGPEALSPLEVVSIFEELAGRPFELQYVPEEALQTQMELTPDPLQQSFAGLMRTLAAGTAIDMKPMQELFPLRLVSVKEYASWLTQPRETIA